MIWSYTVSLDASNLVWPTVRDPFSLYQRIMGVVRTPGPGTYNIKTGEFLKNTLYEASSGTFRQMTGREIFRGGVAHDYILESIGWGAAVGAGAAGWNIYEVIDQINMKDEKWTFEFILAFFLALPGAFLGESVIEVIVCWMCALTLFGIFLWLLGRGDAIMSFIGSASLIVILLTVRLLLRRRGLWCLALYCGAELVTY